MTRRTDDQPKHPSRDGGAHHVFTDQLDLEWERLRRSRRSAVIVRSWASSVDPCLVELFETIDHLDELVAATQRGASADDDQVLLALVALAEHDQLAGRILVQRLLPGLLSGAAKYRFLCDGVDPAEIAVGALWIAIRTFDRRRRPHHVAASLISDAIFAAFRRSGRRKSAGEHTLEPERLADLIAAAGRHPFEELASVVGAARVMGVPRHDLDLIRHLVRAGSPGVVARERAVTPRTVRNQRDRAIRRIRLAVAA